jgi:multiple sugar transport system permease protein
MKNKINIFFSYSFLSVVTIIIAGPFYWMISTSLKDSTKVFSMPPQLIPNPLVFENYVEIFKVQPNFPLYYFNSIYIAVLVTVGTALVASLGGYSFAKIDFPFRGLIFLIFLSGMMIPTEATVIPLFDWMSKLKWTNTHLPLIIPAILGSGGMFGLFMMRQYFITIPNDIDEAAKIDGCNPWVIYYRIMLPMAAPALGSLSLLTFLTNWNEFFTPLIFLSSDKLYTIPLALSLFTDQTGTQWNLVMVASVLATLPLLLIFFLAQKQFIDSIALSGIK